MNACLDNNFDIGIITASARTIPMICDGDKAIAPWMSDKLCKRIQESNGRLFNTTKVISGENRLENGRVYTNDVAKMKTNDMLYSRDKYHPDIPDKCLTLFDDDVDVLKGVNSFNGKLSAVCSSVKCGLERNLSDIDVLNKVKKMVKSGCA